MYRSICLEPTAAERERERERERQRKDVGWGGEQLLPQYLYSLRQIVKQPVWKAEL